MMLDKKKYISTSNSGNNIDRIELICLWFIGFTSTLGIAAVARLGDSHLLTTPLVAIALLVYEIVKCRGKIYTMKSSANLVLGLLIIYISLSMLLPFVYGFGETAEVALYGITVLASKLLVYLSIIINPSEFRFRAVCTGLIAGIILNSLYSIYQYLGFFYGFPWVELKGLVPHAEITATQRVAGFFIEPSYLVGLLVPGLVIVLCFSKRFRLLGASLISIALLLSFSSGLWLAFITIFLYIAALGYIFLFSKNSLLRSSRKQIAGTLLAITVIIVVVSIVAYSLPDRPKLAKAFTKYFDLPESERLQTATLSMSLAFNSYPLGCGYNMGPTVMMEHHGTTKIHSLFGSLLLEIGIPGLILFLLFIFLIAAPLLKKKEDFRAVGLSIAVISSIIYSSLTYNNMFCFQWVLLGIAFLYKHEEEYVSNRYLGRDDAQSACI